VWKLTSRNARLDVGLISDPDQPAPLELPEAPENLHALTPEAKEQLDHFVSEHGNAKRYYIAIEGFTDRSGAVAYNDELSRRRAEHVMAYLITQHDIPVFRVQEIGLGKEKPADEGRNRAARAKNRRVEVLLFSADQELAMSQMPTQTQAQK